MSDTNQQSDGVKQDPHDGFKNMHFLLNHYYYNLLYNEDENTTFDHSQINQLKKFEKEWFGQEQMNCYHHYDLYKTIISLKEVELELKKHFIARHPLLDYLKCKATKKEIRYFLINQSIFNMDFFNYTALALIGVTDEIKIEIMKHLWEEVGRGKVKRSYAKLFSRLLKTFDLTYNREMIMTNMPWEGIACINLFGYLALHSFNKIKYFGFLAATKIGDLLHHPQFLQAIKRFQVIGLNTSYYKGDEKGGRTYIRSWCNRIILPILIEKPHKINDFWLGFYLRLESVKRYYDTLLQDFTIVKPLSLQSHSCYL